MLSASGKEFRWCWSVPAMVDDPRCGLGGAFRSGGIRWIQPVRLRAGTTHESERVLQFPGRIGRIVVTMSDARPNAMKLLKHWVLNLRLGNEIGDDG
jgi:hypothetical protein